ncbi:DUF2232 domain-containing protein [Paenibacillus guangzhouensis]|uniref:DUF2232 domain-containing protein n=1 Tax=Paenibacillus guangzhouensis TaxID=1473112 RepID=UPI001D1012C0|nr:DUF2232 domain-containing protein [Paenibacillus guangzhouensis]
MRWSSALWSIAALLLILSLFTPFQIVTISFIAIPIVVLYATTNVRTFILHMLCVYLVAFLAMGTFGSAAILFAVYFTIPAVVMGRLYRRKASAMAVFVGGTVTVLAESIIMLFVMNTILGFDFNLYLGETVRTSLDPLQTANLMPVGWTPKMTDDLVAMMTQMVPFALIFSSVLIAAVTHTISRRILNRQGVEASKFKPLHEWMLPRSLIWYYFIAVLADMFISDTDTSFVTVVLVNLLPLLKIAFMIQTVCFFFFVAHIKQWNRILPILFVIPLFIFPPLRIIGLLDIAFPIRQSLVKPKM